MNLIEQIKAKFSANIVEVVEQQGDTLIYVQREAVLKIMESLKMDAGLQFDLLMDLFAVDYLHWEEKVSRFEVVYNLFSTSKNLRLFVKVAVPEKDPVIDSVVSIWPAANWYEREVWDMFGVSFNGHPDLRRILMYDSFQGHALRKDYRYNKRQPLIGPVN